MATASMLHLTLHWQNEIALCDNQIAGITSKQYGLVRKSSDLAEQRQEKLSEVSQDDPAYYETIKQIKADFKTQEKELAMLEENMEQELNNWQTRRSMAKQYYDSYNSGLQSGIQSDFTPFPTS